MHYPRLPRPVLAGAAGLAVALAATATAGATEGPAASPPVPPWNLSAPGFGLAPSSPSTAAKQSRPRISGARIVPRKVAKGKHARLRLTLPQAGQVRYTMTRRSRPHRGKVTAARASVPAGRVSIRLPAKVKGQALATGRYRISVVVVDGQGGRSRTVKRSFVVRSAKG